MVSVTPKNVVGMSLSGVGETHARTKVAVRDVGSVIDEPAARGGSNQGLTPTETLIASLIGCTNVITHRIAERVGARVEGLRVDAVAQFDRRGAALEREIDVPFPKVELTVSLRTDATPEQVERIKADLGKYCPISKVIRAAGTDIKETWTIEPL